MSSHARPKRRANVIRAFSVAASAVSVCGGTWWRAAWIAAKSDCDAGRRISDRCATETTVGENSRSVHGAGAERDGQRPRKNRIEVCGARARTRREPIHAVGELRADAAASWPLHAEPSLMFSVRRQSPPGEAIVR